MATSVTEIGYQLGSIVATLGVSMVVAGVVAWGSARMWGKTKRSRQAIAGIVGTAGVLLALLIAQLRFRAVG